VALVVTRTRGLVRFEVNDTGPGIEPDMRRRIFREFEQGDGTLTRRHGGTGLGLAIAARIVERMGSEIVLDATDAGSRFSFAVELPEIIDAESPTHPPQLNGIDILIVSPSPIVGPLLARRLSAWGAKAVNADKDTLAETLLRERAWQHVLVDRAFGFETTMKIVGNAAKCAQYRHVLLSPSERAELEVLRAGGFDSYLVKPVRAASLAARLATPALSPPLVPEFEDEPPASREPAGGRLTVLVAEDNEINALLVQAMLARLGHAPTVVGNGIAAVTTVATAHAMGAPYDVVLMDLHLPGLDGIEATRRIRALGGNGGAVPIVALTANAFIEDREACREAGMDGFITKPVDRARLEEAIAAACATRRGNAVSAA
jgi:CheY-like chemotaxis protein